MIKAAVWKGDKKRDKKIAISPLPPSPWLINGWEKLQGELIRGGERAAVAKSAFLNREPTSLRSSTSSSPSQPSWILLISLSFHAKLPSDSASRQVPRLICFCFCSSISKRGLVILTTLPSSAVHICSKPDNLPVNGQQILNGNPSMQLFPQFAEVDQKRTGKNFAENLFPADINYKSLLALLFTLTAQYLAAVHQTGYLRAILTNYEKLIGVHGFDEKSRDRRSSFLVSSSWSRRLDKETRLRFKSRIITRRRSISHNEANLLRPGVRNHRCPPKTFPLPWWSFSPRCTENTKVSRDLNFFYIPIKEDIGGFRHQICSPTFYPSFTQPA